ncbi:acetoacetate decarboxylase family protein [Catenovulum sp. 2E275]|uniref:acetoacetate decarboxylase family protein n=1 Tax=Catenovulum sp. 2E275 TaxID=2980497 RepID=UPI0021CE34B6|nr:acetoacetate decarboxylase family protein [Catenovulum sp. 2E275]MCU4677137.1 acetoacetate decarboxylase family protein [Catenovulum sp. 2E275]
MNNNLYARFPGQVIATPPCRMLNANMYGFFIKGDAKCIQQYLDQTINQVKVDNMSFKALSSYCMLTFTDIENIKPTTPPFSEQGWFQETDIIIWLPVAQLINNKIDHIYWYPAFICVNNIYALVNGREIWGFNKYLCDYTMPTSGEEPDFFNITVDAFKQFSPNTKMAPCELFNIKLKQNNQEKKIDGFVELIKEGFDILKDHPDFFNFDLNILKQMLSGLFHPQIDQLLFKQFPDGTASKAVYQSVVHSPSVIQKIHDIKLYFHEFEFSLNQMDMFPLEQMFGIKTGTQTPLLPFNVLFDFNQEEAILIAENK